MLFFGSNGTTEDTQSVCRITWCPKYCGHQLRQQIQWKLRFRLPCGHWLWRQFRFIRPENQWRWCSVGAKLSTQKEDFFFGDIGYRYQRPNGFMFRVGVSPSFNFGDKYGLNKAAFFPYIGFGWSF